MIQRPAPADPAIAEATFRKHLDELWATGRPARLGWERSAIDGLHELVGLPAERSDGTVDRYHVLLGAEYYDAAPPTAAFVERDTLKEAQPNSAAFPTFASVPPWFHLHAGYQFPPEFQANGSATRQLVCFTGTAQYYMVDHAPPEEAIWQQGRHTLAMTLNRLHEVLHQPYYRAPSDE